MLVQLSITELAEGLRAKKFSVVDLVRECYERIDKYEKKINSFITLIDKKEALAVAEKKQKLLSSSSSPLTGIPFVMKDAYLTEGILTTAASKVLSDFIPPYSATVYERLLASGAILIGKMNMDAWGHGASTENTDYGPTRNPWDLTRSAGGSGGGPAAALAARFCSFAIGEDTGGSIRNPAAWCDVTALKVTYGRVSRYGAIAYASSLDTMGPTAKSAQDVAYVLEAIAGKDPYDATSSPIAVPKYSDEIAKGIRGMTIGVPMELLAEGVEPDIKKAILTAVEELKRLGIHIENVSIPMSEYCVPLYYITAPSETSSNLARYDGIRYGNERKYFTKETMRRIMTGTYALSSGYYDAYYRKAQKARTVFIEKYTSLLSKYDAILMPVMPSSATKLGHLLDDPVKNMLIDIYTVLVNIIGVPSLALPCGFTKNGLPVGMQLVGRMFSEDILLRIGHAYQRKTDWHSREPKL